MIEWPTIAGAIVAALVLIGILLTMVLWKKRKDLTRTESNYKAFFIMGVAIFPSGTIFMIIYLVSGLPFFIGMPLSAMGLVYLVIGLANRHKWKTTADTCQSKER